MEQDRELFLLDAATGSPLFHLGKGSGAQFSADGLVVVALGDCLRAYEASSGKLLRSVCPTNRHDRFVRFAVTAAGDFLAFDEVDPDAGHAGKPYREEVRVVSIRTGEIHAFAAPAQPAGDVRLGLLTAGRHGEIIAGWEGQDAHVLDPVAGTMRRAFHGAHLLDGAAGVALGMEGKAYEFGRIVRVDTGTWQELGAVDDPRCGRVMHVEFSLEGRHFVTVGERAKGGFAACAWEAATGRLLRTLPPRWGGHLLEYASLSPDGSLTILTEMVGDTMRVRVVENATGAEHEETEFTTANGLPAVRFASWVLFDPRRARFRLLLGAGKTLTIDAPADRVATWQKLTAFDMDGEGGWVAIGEGGGLLDARTGRVFEGPGGGGRLVIHSDVAFPYTSATAWDLREGRLLFRKNPRHRIPVSAGLGAAGAEVVGTTQRWHLPLREGAVITTAPVPENGRALVTRGGTFVLEEGRLTDLDRGRSVSISLAGRAQDVNAVATPSGDRLVLATEKTALFVDLRTGASRAFPLGYSQPPPLAISADGERFAVGEARTTRVFVRRSSEWDEVAVQAAADALTFREDGTLVGVGNDHWTFDTAGALSRACRLPAWPHEATLDPTGTFYVYVSRPWEIHVMSRETCTEVRKLSVRTRDDRGRIRLAVGSNGRTVIGVHTNGLVSVWQDRDSLPTMELATDGNAMVARARDGRVSRVSGDGIDHLVRCRVGEALLPFSICDDRVLATQGP
jgi:hypothetical protein